MAARSFAAIFEMDDATAYMALALNNPQGELSPLEVGLHALHSGLSGSEYARQVGMKQQTLSERGAGSRRCYRISGSRQVAISLRHPPRSRMALADFGL